jgi:hypothetical protein
MPIPITLPPVSSSATRVTRSSFAFLKQNGAACEQGEPVAYCCVHAAANTHSDELPPLAQDKNDLFAIFLAPTTGTIRWDHSMSRGGWLDFLPGLAPIEWRNEEVILGTIEPSPGDSKAPLSLDQSVIITVGHRVVEWADPRGGILPGWYNNIRSWTFSERPFPIIVATSCVFRFAVLGEQRTSHEMHLNAARPLHVDYQGDSLLVPTVGTLLEELLRTPEETAAIMNEMRRWLSSLTSSEPWSTTSLIGILMERVANGSPLTRKPIILQRSGIATIEEAPAIALSAESEDALIFKHTSLPLTLAFTNLFRIPKDFQMILINNFVRVPPRPVEELALSYQHLSHILSQKGSKLFITNNFVHEPGSPLIRPAWNTDIKTSYSFRTRRINDALLDLQARNALTVLNFDLLKATLGGKTFPDSSHGDRHFDARSRELILEAM